MITQKQFNENATPTNPDAKLRKGDVISSVCEIPNCNKQEYRIGWCKNHYNLLCRNRAK